jgi:hypothetical protein
MNVEIGAEAALFPEKEYINGIAVAVCNMENKVFCDEEVFEQIRPCGGGGGGDDNGQGPGGGHQAHKRRRWRSASFWRKIPRCIQWLAWSLVPVPITL